MTRTKLEERYPTSYAYYKLIADKEHLWEEVLSTFEQSNVPDDASRFAVERALSHALYEWDI